LKYNREGPVFQDPLQKQGENSFQSSIPERIGPEPLKKEDYKMSVKAFDGVFEMPVQGRTVRPRKNGVTMLIDKGLGLSATEDLMQMASDAIDMVKMTFGTTAFMDMGVVEEKIEILKSYDVYTMPGGTFMEVAVWQKRYPQYLLRCRDLGFNAIEVSDGTIEFDMKTRKDCIKRAVDMGFLVLTEVGKKDANEKVSMSLMHEEIASDLACGAAKVIVEAREAGKGVGIFDGSGNVKTDEIDAIIAGVDDPTVLEWEAPIKNQQQHLIMRFGSNVNLGNIPPEDILALEALRCGLRGDTLKKAWEVNKGWKKK
jgi:phosphosulfolactate synthase